MLIKTPTRAGATRAQLGAPTVRKRSHDSRCVQAQGLYCLPFSGLEFSHLLSQAGAHSQRPNKRGCLHCTNLAPSHRRRG